jgi:aminoglycoside phosphotransferase (APT) family kinase protein
VPAAGPAISRGLGAGGSVNEQLVATIDRLMGRLDEFVAPGWIGSPVARDACLWLHDNMPVVEPADTVIVHGDFRMGNVIWDGLRIAALLDWERATVGDRMQDLAFFCMPMARQRRPDLLGMLLTRAQLFSSWERLTGRAIDLRRLHYFLVYWQYVELAQVLRGIVYMIDSAPPGEVRSLTSYPLLSAGTVQLVELIERFEDGDHDMR